MSHYPILDMIVAGEIDAVHIRASVAYRQRFLEDLAPFNLSRHKLVIDCYGASSLVMLLVDGAPYFHVSASAEVGAVIWKIGQTVDDGDHTWAPKLKGVKLT